MSSTSLRIIGSSAHSQTDRDINDYYATDPKALELLLNEVDINKNIFEPSCGEGHLSKLLIDRGFNVKSSDLIDRGFGTQVDFLKTYDKFDGDIITNPPYKCAQEFIQKSLDIVDDGSKVIMFLRLQFLEGKARKIFFKNNPPHTIYVSSSRVLCAKNGEFDKYNKSSVTAYAWFIWIKGYKGETKLKWFN